MAKRRKDEVPAGFEHAPKNAHMSERHIPGTVEITLERPDGSVEQMILGVTPGIPKLRVPGSKEIVDTAMLMKVAAGGTLSESEAAECPILEKWGQSGAMDFIHAAASKRAGWLKNHNNQ